MIKRYIFNSNCCKVALVLYRFISKSYMESAYYGGVYMGNGLLLTSFMMLQFTLMCKERNLL